MLPIKPHLWFDQGRAVEAAEFYTGLMPNSFISTISELPMPTGKCDLVDFTFAGQSFLGISSGSPSLKFSPAISVMINFDPSRDADAAERINEVWSQLLEGGTVMMPLDRYPFSERYGWLSDKYGLSWQLILTNPAGEERPVVIPSMMYTGAVAGKAEEAIDFYCAAFKGSKRGNTARYPKGMEPDQEGTLTFADFYIDNTWLAAMDSARPHDFNFNEAVSLLIPCETQEEIDHYWSALSANPDAGQCGWLKDKFGVSWQISSTFMLETLKNGTQEQIKRVNEAFMQMKKVDIAALQQAYKS